MRLRQWLEKWNMTSLRITAPFLDLEWKPSDPDKGAAWALYIELLTRIATQRLADGAGDEASALASVYSLFPTTRATIKEHGRECVEFTKIAVVILNQVVRPFTEKWHRLSMNNGFGDPSVCRQFREDLGKLQPVLRTYCAMLADMAGVEDLTSLEG